MAESTVAGGVASAIPIVGPLVGAGINAISGAVQNKKQRKWNEKMYARQRQDALADWAMQNAYNSPAEQMKRLKEAGLNPNLVYGHGADATSNQAVRSSEMAKYTPQAFDIGSGVSQASSNIYDAALKQQQLLNMKMALAAMASSINNKDADTASKVAGTRGKELANWIAENTKETSVMTKEALLRNLGYTGNLTAAKTALELQQFDFNLHSAPHRMNALMKRNQFMDWQMKSGDYQNSLRAAQIGLNSRQSAREDQRLMADLKMKAEIMLNLAIQSSKTEAEKDKIRAEIPNIKNATDAKTVDQIIQALGIFSR